MPSHTLFLEKAQRRLPRCPRGRYSICYSFRPTLGQATAKLAGEDAAVFRGLRFHDLRHCAITCLAESRESKQTIMPLAGHLYREMLERYSHMGMAAKSRAVEAIKPAFEIPVEEPQPQTKILQ